MCPMDEPVVFDTNASFACLYSWSMILSIRKRYTQRFFGGGPDEWTLRMPVHVRSRKGRGQARGAHAADRSFPLPSPQRCVHPRSGARPCACVTLGSSSTRPSYLSMVYHSLSCAMLVQGRAACTPRLVRSYSRRATSRPTSRRFPLRTPLSCAKTRCTCDGATGTRAHTRYRFLSATRRRRARRRFTTMSCHALGHCECARLAHTLY
jgi:hypothetical protein